MDIEKYIARQDFNAITRSLHSFRYRSVLSIVGELSHLISDRPLRVLEIGCAHAKVFPLLAQRFSIEYFGIELQPDRAEYGRRTYGDQPNFAIVQGSAIEYHLYDDFAPDIVLALEVLEHIPEREVVRLVEHLATLRTVRFFVFSVPVEVGPALVIKNVGSFLMGYMRHREYTWRETFWAGCYRLDKLPPHGVRHKGFDWRWLAQTVRQNMAIREIRKSPVAFVPGWLAPSVLFVAGPRPAGSPELSPAMA